MNPGGGSWLEKWRGCAKSLSTPCTLSHKKCTKNIVNKAHKHCHIKLAKAYTTNCSQETFTIFLFMYTLTRNSFSILISCRMIYVRNGHPDALFYRKKTPCRAAHPAGSNMEVLPRYKPYPTVVIRLPWSFQWELFRSMKRTYNLVVRRTWVLQMMKKLGHLSIGTMFQSRI